ncbi:hypothetical protein BD626DRAFT_414471 [Schizophyllum amplum]|uniref:Uncharacterized protein n=1 Tax=Schizophyllum amplum TaxID=97359 RepID=A0A550BUP3_9AGAR|nr:hypothetical protein BD626DRAFT_414471 [Auriculariopsis ampla]
MNSEKTAQQPALGADTPPAYVPPAEPSHARTPVEEPQPSSAAPVEQPAGVHLHPPAPQPQPDAAQLGEQYRAELFARCAQGVHDPTTKYGMCGIITAVLCFPCGLICLFSDAEQRCDRCGVKL